MCYFLVKLPIDCLIYRQFCLLRSAKKAFTFDTEKAPRQLSDQTQGFEQFNVSPLNMSKVMKKLFSCFLITAAVLVFNSCQKPMEVESSLTASTRQGLAEGKTSIDLSVKGDYEFRNGMLFFKTAETFLALDKDLRGKTPEKRIEFTKQLGFQSLLDIQLQVYDLLNRSENLGKFNEILSSNADIFQTEGDYITSKFDMLSSALLNRESMVSIGKNIHCFAKGKTIIASTIEEVREAYKT